MFQPTVIGGGLVGWQFLRATQERQKEVFDAQPAIQRDTQYFSDNIGRISSAEELVSDRRLLKVALGAFGLQDDIDNRFFVKKVLEEGVEDRSSLANRLADDRYKSLAREFQFASGSTSPRGTPEFAREIISRFQSQEFEIAVGEANPSLRLAMNFERQVPELVADEGSDNAKWFRVLGSPPLRSVFEGALGLPSSFGQLDIDRQRDIFEDKASRKFGIDSFSDLAGPGTIADMVQTFLVREQAKLSESLGRGRVALALLSQSR